MNSGSEANDLALLMARAYTGNYDVIALRNAYHGGNASGMAVTAHSTWKYNVPHSFGVHHALAPYPYRGPYGYDDADAGQKYAADVKSLIDYATPGKVADDSKASAEVRAAARRRAGTDDGRRERDGRRAVPQAALLVERTHRALRLDVEAADGAARRVRHLAQVGVHLLHVLVHCRDNLTGYKMPKRIEFRDALPRTETGKLQRFRLKAGA